MTKKTLRKGIFLFRTQMYVKKTKKFLRNFIYETFFTKILRKLVYGNKNYLKKNLLLVLY